MNMKVTASLLQVKASRFNIFPWAIGKRKGSDTQVKVKILVAACTER